MNFQEQFKNAVCQHQQNLLKIQERVKELERFPLEVLDVPVGSGQQSAVSWEKYNYAGVYAIFAADPSRVQDIVSDLKAYRELETREHCVPKPSNSKDENPSGCLYVGKSLEKLNDRLRKHLSNPENKNKTTFALKMNLWLKRPEQLQVCLIRIHVNNALDRVLVSECENALRNYLCPAIGE